MVVLTECKYTIYMPNAENRRITRSPRSMLSVVLARASMATCSVNNKAYSKTETIRNRATILIRTVYM